MNFQRFDKLLLRSPDDQHLIRDQDIDDWGVIDTPGHAYLGYDAMYRYRVESAASDDPMFGYVPDRLVDFSLEQ